MNDRSSRPHRSPQLVSRGQEEHVALLRQVLGAGADTIASLTGIPRSTVHRIVRRRGLQRPKLPREPVVRYEYAEPGAMVHVDTKKLGRIVGGPGHRAHGDKSRQRHSGVGWEVLHVAVDDCTRLVYCEVLADEKGRRRTSSSAPCAGSVSRASPSTDCACGNGSPYRSKAWRRVCRPLS